MTKLWETKRKIMDLIVDKKVTLGDISNALDLAPSTVSQHLKELSKVGKIKVIGNSVHKKPKYYEPAGSYYGSPGPNSKNSVVTS